jgi:hypothetical protein
LAGRSPKVLESVAGGLSPKVQPLVTMTAGPIRGLSLPPVRPRTRSRPTDLPRFRPFRPPPASQNQITRARNKSQGIGPEATTVLVGAQLAGAVLAGHGLASRKLTGPLGLACGMLGMLGNWPSLELNPRRVPAPVGIDVARDDPEA